MSKQRSSHRQALRPLLNHWCIDRAKWIGQILRVGDRFDYNPRLAEALNVGDGSYKS